MWSAQLLVPILLGGHIFFKAKIILKILWMQHFEMDKVGISSIFFSLN